MLDELKSVLGVIPKLQSQLSKLAEKVNGIEGRFSGLLKQSDYRECEACGNLCKKSRMQSFATKKSEYSKNEFTIDYFSSFLRSYYGDAKTNEESQLIYLCNHCSVKEFKKKNQIK